MELLKRLMVEEDGQGLVEYTLIVVLVALVFWVAIKRRILVTSWPVVGARLRRALAIRLLVARPRSSLGLLDCSNRNARLGSGVDFLLLSRAICVIAAIQI